MSGLNERIYKRTIYWLNTKKYCGAIAKDQNGDIYVYDTAPCYKWAAKRNMKFSQLLAYYRSKNWLISCQKIDVEIDPF
ncbi:MAG: hypothetical protein ACTSVB_00855 [Candidatus Heimdallarchaeaceae archaeon]